MVEPNRPASRQDRKPTRKETGSGEPSGQAEKPFSISNTVLGWLVGTALLAQAFTGGLLYANRNDPTPQPPIAEQVYQPTIATATAQYRTIATEHAGLTSDDGPDDDIDEPPTNCSGAIRMDLRPNQPTDIVFISDLVEDVAFSHLEQHEAIVRGVRIPYICAITFYPNHQITVTRLGPIPPVQARPAPPR